MKKGKLGTVLKVLLWLFTVALGTLPFFVFKDEIGELAALGYIGLFAACFFTNASLMLPSAGIAFTLSAATALSGFWCAIVGGLGTTLGEMSGYLLGRLGRSSVRGGVFFDKMEGLLSKWGYLAVFLFALMPMPIFDFIGIGAGTAKMPPVAFFLVCGLGKILKMLIYVYIVSGVLAI